jgi:Fe-S oxidoreductase
VKKTPIQVALMIPYYIDLFHPEVGVATLELLEEPKVDVVKPLVGPVAEWSEFAVNFLGAVRAPG